MSMEQNRMTLVERFLKYIAYDTMSSETSGNYPSSPSQLLFADMMVNDLKEIGVSDAYKDEYGLVYGHINLGKARTIGLIAHMDTSPALEGGCKNPRLIKNYDGGVIVLNDKYSMSPKVFPELNYVKGDDIIVTDGDHLLGADDKAGVVLIFEIAKYVLEHKDEFNNNLAICFTPDEEVGGGWKHFDVKKMNANFAFTMDGGESFVANHENFNAAAGHVEIKGVSIHPGSAKNIMQNAGSIAAEFQNLLPKEMVPEKTDGYDGFIMLENIKGDIDSASLDYIIRDFNKELLEKKKAIMLEAGKKIQALHPTAKIEVTIKDSYRNMGDYFIEHPEGVEMINKAYLASKLKLQYEPIRGGTDGAMITYMGLPCPNLGTGGANFHGRYEYWSINQANTMLEVLKNLLKE